MPTPTTSGRQSQTDALKPQISPIVLIAAVAALGVILAFLIYHNFSAPATTTTKAQPQSDSPEKYGLPFFAPPQAVEMRKRQMPGAPPSSGR